MFVSTFLDGYGKSLLPCSPFFVSHEEDGSLQFWSVPTQELAGLGSWLLFQCHPDGSTSETSDSVVVAAGPGRRSWWVQTAFGRCVLPPGWHARDDQLPMALTIFRPDRDELIGIFAPETRISEEDFRREARLVGRGVTNGYPWFEVSYRRQGQAWRQRLHQVRLPGIREFAVKVQYREGTLLSTASQVLDSLEAPLTRPQFLRRFAGNELSSLPHRLYLEEGDALAVLSWEAWQALDSDLKAHLNRACDPAGAACAAHGFGAKWREVWRESIQQLQARWAKRHFVVMAVNLSEGEYEVALESGAEATGLAISGYTSSEQIALVVGYSVFGPPSEDALWLNLPDGPKRISVRISLDKKLLLQVLPTPACPERGAIRCVNQ